MGYLQILPGCICICKPLMSEQVLCSLLYGMTGNTSAEFLCMQSCRKIGALGAALSKKNVILQLCHLLAFFAHYGVNLGRQLPALPSRANSLHYCCCPYSPCWDLLGIKGNKAIAAIDFGIIVILAVHIYIYFFCLYRCLINWTTDGAVSEAWLKKLF